MTDSQDEYCRACGERVENGERYISIDVHKEGPYDLNEAEDKELIVHLSCFTQVIREW